MDIPKNLAKSWFSKLVDLSDNDRLTPGEKANLEVILWQMSNEIKYPQVHRLYIKAPIYIIGATMVTRVQFAIFEYSIQ